MTFPARRKSWKSYFHFAPREWVSRGSLDCSEFMRFKYQLHLFVDAFRSWPTYYFLFSGSNSASPFFKDVMRGGGGSNSLEAAPFSSRHLSYFSLVIPPFFHQHTLIILWFSDFLCPCCAPHRVAFFPPLIHEYFMPKIKCFFPSNTFECNVNTQWVKLTPLSDLFEWSNKS